MDLRFELGGLNVKCPRFLDRNIVQNTQPNFNLFTETFHQTLSGLVVVS